MLTDGTCWVDDFMLPADKIKQLDHWSIFLADRKRLEERLQNMAEELRAHNWEVKPPVY